MMISGSRKNILVITVYFFTLEIVTCGLIGRNDHGKNEEPITLIEYENNLRQDGYDFNIETSDGFSKNENATVDKTGELKIKGDYYINFPNGQYEFHEYEAGVNGVRSNVVFGNPVMKSKKISSAAIASLVGGGLG
ncbi:uncharacterized protein LOC130450307 [Diorhabda sublineata]|uniref:uncharacterized protein LOC130450307 n=1 Tax=Diorhabda sublineata TaxID=1163346 RepID=UPI0024E1006A|nr:uncharacterized protein LOC130450307 [Diorhabda sublineata]